MSNEESNERCCNWKITEKFKFKLIVSLHFTNNIIQNVNKLYKLIKFSLIDNK